MKIEKTNQEAECPKCGALIYIGEMEKYEMVDCHECDEPLEFDGTGLIVLENNYFTSPHIVLNETYGTAVSVNCFDMRSKINRAKKQFEKNNKSKFGKLKIGDKLFSTHSDSTMPKIICMNKMEDSATFKWIESFENPFTISKDDLEQSYWKIWKPEFTPSKKVE